MENSVYSHNAHIFYFISFYFLYYLWSLVFFCCLIIPSIHNLLLFKNAIVLIFQSISIHFLFPGGHKQAPFIQLTHKKWIPTVFFPIRLWSFLSLLFPLKKCSLEHIFFHHSFPLHKWVFSHIKKIFFPLPFLQFPPRLYRDLVLCLAPD